MRCAIIERTDLDDVKGLCTRSISIKLRIRERAFVVLYLSTSVSGNGSESIIEIPTETCETRTLDDNIQSFVRRSKNNAGITKISNHEMLSGIVLVFRLLNTNSN